MKNKLLFITDNFNSLNYKKDTSVLMIEEAIKNNFEVYQCEISNLYVNENCVYSDSKNIRSENFIEFNQSSIKPIKLSEFKYIFMRKDPPVDGNFINALHLLGLAEKQGAKVYNNPNSIKEFNEKIFALHFKKYIPDTLITSDIDKIKFFANKHKSIVVKPFDGMGGASIHKIDNLNDKNITLLSNMTNSEKTQIICQEFIDDIYDGDFRILIIHGKPFSKTLARIPQDGSFKGNLAAGGKGIAKDITMFQKNVGNEIGEYLNKRGINFAGIDMIGDYLTEINITSPTCAQEILEQTNMNPIKDYFRKL